MAVSESTTKFCKKCNTETLRYKTGRCKPCANARSVAWYAANAEKVKEAKKAYHASNREARNAYNAGYRAANADKMKERNAAWYAENRDRQKLYFAAWEAKNPDKRKILRQNRKARKREAGGRLSRGLVEKLLKLQRGKCACGCKQPLGDDYHIDHIMPLALGGSHADENIQLLRSTCNLKKHAKHPVDYMQSKGFLL